MATLWEDLRQLDEEGSPIRVGIIGCGQMGIGLLAQIPSVPGMVVRGICDHDAAEAERGREVYRDALERLDGKPHDEVNAIVTSDDYREIVRLDEVDVVIEATGVTEVGAQVSMEALLAQKHLVLLNVEMDITIGSILKKMFDAAGLIYTGSNGDEPAVTFDLYQFARLMGFEVLVIGKGKNNKLQLYANPETAKEEAAQKHMSPRMLASFQDGTKTMAEMTLLSNATGYLPDVPGMHGIAGDLDETVAKLDLKDNGGVLSSFGVVEYVDGLAPGVFIIVKGQNPVIAQELNYFLKKGERDHHILYRPFHLGGMETPITVARAFLYGESAIVPLGAPVSDTVAVAKRDIKAGEAIDGIGGFSVRGMIESHAVQKKERHIPIGLIEGNCVAKRDIAKDAILTEEDVALDDSLLVVKLRAMQDTLIG